MGTYPLYWGYDKGPDKITDKEKVRKYRTGKAALMSRITCPECDKLGSYSYLDLPGLTSRANSAMGRIEMIMARTDVSSAARLALIAGVMANEPILTDRSTAAGIARREARQRGEYAH